MPTMTTLPMHMSRGIARGPWPPNRQSTGFLNGKKLLCWDVRPALFSKVTLFCLEKCSVSSPRAQVLRAMTKKVTFLRKKCTLAASVAPNVKCWLRCCTSCHQHNRDMYGSQWVAWAFTIKVTLFVPRPPCTDVIQN